MNKRPGFNGLALVCSALLGACGSNYLPSRVSPAAPGSLEVQLPVPPVTGPGIPTTVTSVPVLPPPPVSLPAWTFPLPVPPPSTTPPDYPPPPPSADLTIARTPLIFTSLGAGGFARVRVLGERGESISASPGSLIAYDPAFRGGASIAAADINRDGFPDVVTGAGPGGGPHVNLFDGRTGVNVGGFFAYDEAFTGGVYVATGDVNGDGTPDIITGAGAGGGPHVRVFDGRTLGQIRSFMAYDVAFTGGVRVASADFDGDGRWDIFTAAGTGGGPHVRVIGANGAELLSFMAYGTFTGGVYIAAADVDGDGRPEIVTGADRGGEPIVKVFSRTGAELRSFPAYQRAFGGGVRVSALDIDGDGRDEILTAAGTGGGPHIAIFDGQTAAPLRDFFAETVDFTGGVFVAGAQLGASPASVRWINDSDAGLPRIPSAPPVTTSDVFRIRDRRTYVEPGAPAVKGTEFLMTLPDMERPYIRARYVTEVNTVPMYLVPALNVGDRARATFPPCNGCNFRSTPSRIAAVGALAPLTTPHVALQGTVTEVFALGYSFGLDWAISLDQPGCWVRVANPFGGRLSSVTVQVRTPLNCSSLFRVGGTATFFVPSDDGIRMSYEQINAVESFRLERY